MKYNKIQKIISILLLFIFLFGQITGLSFLGFLKSTKTFAGEEEKYDLVSIIVDESTYNNLSLEIKRYAQDIQNYLNNTKVVIFPIKESTTSFQLASLNEGLFFEGYKGLKKSVAFSSRLVGTILIGKIPIPIISKKGEFSKSIVPYVDFKDKKYIYNNKTGLFKENEDNKNGLKAEIWHGIIPSDNFLKIKKFLDKDHNFYTNTGAFLKIKNEEPYVFYFDAIREEKSISYNLYKGYEAYLNNREDLVYHRYNKELAKKVQKEALGGANEEIKGLLDKVGNTNNNEISTLDFEGSSDISLKFFIENIIKTFIETFGKGTISDFRKNVYNAGRYNKTNTKINIDTIPGIITKLDYYVDNTLKTFNDISESNLGYYLKKGPFFAMPLSIVDSGTFAFSNSLCSNDVQNSFYGILAKNISDPSYCSIKVGDDNDGGQLVEYNRAYNIKKIESDFKICKKGETSGYWGGYSPINLNLSDVGELELDSKKIKGITIVPLKDPAGSKKIEGNPATFKDCLNGKFIELRKYSDFSDAGSSCVIEYQAPVDGLKAINYGCDSTIITRPGFDYIQMYRSIFEGNRLGTYCSYTQIVLNLVDTNGKILDTISTINRQNKCQNPVAEFCLYDEDAGGYIYKGCSSDSVCTAYEEREKLRAESNDSGDDDEEKEDAPLGCGSICDKTFKRTITYTAVKLPVALKHSSPTNSEINSQLNNLSTPSLGIDKKRYFSYTTGYPTFSLKKIYSLNLFEDKIPKNPSLSPNVINQMRNQCGLVTNQVDVNLDALLDRPSSEYKEFNFLDFLVNKYVRDNGEYVDFHDDIADGEVFRKVDLKALAKFLQEWKKFTLKQKYDYILKYYLIDPTISRGILEEFVSEGTFSSVKKYYIYNYLLDYKLPSNRSLYDIAYLGSYGDPENMYIKIDPKGKLENPYSNILEKTSKLDIDGLSLGILNSDSSTESENLKCTPPDGVPIWEWLPAIKCRLDNLLPEKIGVDWICGSNLFDEDDENSGLSKDVLEQEYENDQKNCTKDEDKNGLNDCLENRISKIELKTDKEKLPFNSEGKITSIVEDNSGNRILIDNFSNIKIYIDKIIDTETGNIIFDSTIDDFYDKKSIINEYIYFKPVDIKAEYGKVKINFSTKNKQADIIFKAEGLLKPRRYVTNKIDLGEIDEHNYNSEVNSEQENLSEDTEEKKFFSNELTVKIRQNSLYLSSNILDKNGDLKTVGGKIKANSETNIYLFSGDFKDVSNLNKNSLLLSIEELNNSGSVVDINFPLNVILKDSNGLIVKKELINNLDSIKEFFNIKKSGEYNLIIINSDGFSSDFKFEVLSGDLENIKLDLGTSILDSNGGISSNVISLYDEYGNIISGELFDYKIKILGESVVFNESGKKELDFSGIEGYKAFRLKATGNVGNSKILVEIYKNGEKIKTTSKNIRTIDELSLDLSFDKILRIGGDDYKASIVFKDKNGKILSDFNSRVYLTGVDDFFSKENTYIDIIGGNSTINLKTKTKSSNNVILNFRIEGFSGVYNKSVTILPGKPMKISVLPTKTKIKTGESTQVNVILKDIYNNTVFTDSSSNISVEVDSNSSNLIDIDTLQKKLDNGETSFLVSSKNNIGNAYLKFKIDKNLEDNEETIEYIDSETKLSKELKINGISENALKLEIYDFFNDFTDRYNSLYTTLLGAAYGDFTFENSLASKILFDGYKSLAVTSLIDTPYSQSNIISIYDNGVFEKKSISGDLTQDINIKLVKGNNGKYYIDLFNKALNIHIGKIYLNFDNLNITEDSYKILSQNKFNFSDFGIKEFSSYLAKNDSQLDIYLNTTHNNFIFYLDSSYYSLKKQDFGNKKVLSIIYNDPFANEYSLNVFAKENISSYENFKNDGNLGWRGDNKTLLEFSSGVSVGEAVKKYMGPLVVNLGDPVISLNKIKKSISTPKGSVEKKFDSTIGRKLNDTRIKSYSVFDYNGDGNDDVLFVDISGDLKILENINKRFDNEKSLFKVLDLGNPDLVVTGDFSGDYFDDIFFVDNKGNPNLLNNINGKFSRINLTDAFNLLGKIVSAKSFDMDNDGLDDIITLDDNGDINIFYGEKSTINFTKKLISSGYAIELDSSKTTNNLSAIYFDGMNYEEDSGDYQYLEDLVFEKLKYDLETDRDKENYTKTTKFLKGEFSDSVGIEIKRLYEDKNGGSLKAGDIVKVKLVIKNNSPSKIEKIVYAEGIPEYFILNYKTLKLSRDDIKVRKRLGRYSFYLDKFTLNPGENIEIEYELTTKALSSKIIDVGLFEKGEAGDDEFGDILVKESIYNCGGNQEIFRSISSRTYQKGIKEEVCDNNEEFSDLNDIGENIEKLDLENIEKLDLEKELSDVVNENYVKSIPLNSLILNDLDETIDSLSDKIIEGFNCGFGGTDCVGLPMNWAPLAAGNDPVLFGNLIGDGLKVDEGIPIFSAFTGLEADCGSSQCCKVSFWPRSSNEYIPGPSCGSPGAGGMLGVDSKTNFFRLYATPTLTGGFGVASCFGSTARDVGNIPSKGVSPLIAGGNCIVSVKKPNNICKDSELKQNPETLGTINYIGGDYGIINGNCEFDKSKKIPTTNKIDTESVKKFLQYKNGGITEGDFKQEYESVLQSISSSNTYERDNNIFKGDSPIVDLDIEVGGLDFSPVDEIENKITPSFPDFITGWVEDQLLEFVNKLTSFPTLYIIPPENDNIITGDWGNYVDNLRKDINTLKYKSGIKELYEFLGKIPYINLQFKNIYLDYPIISQSDSDGTIGQYEYQLKEYENKINIFLEENKDSISPESLTKLNKFKNTVRQNLIAIDSYTKFGDQILNLLGKKETRLEQLTCDIEEIQKMIGGWIYNNGKIFKSWVQTFLLVKSALKSWQLLADIFIDYDAECHECKNERYDSIGAQFSWISMILPKFPVIEFPKWPDIVLDLHNIRMGINLVLPEFKLRKKNIVLPPLPRLVLPEGCVKGDLEVPDIPVLPIIKLGNLPDLPAIPTVKLPDLPPPPKLPKILGVFEGVLDTMKLITKAMCLLKQVPLVPEYRVGDQIAYLTEGAGYRSFDFNFLLSPKLPSISWTDEIRITTYLNLENDVDYLIEMANSIVEPINNLEFNFFKIKGPFIKIDFSGVCGNGGIGYNKDIKKIDRKNFSLFNLSKIFAYGIQKVQKCIEKKSSDTLTAQEFLTFVNKQLSSSFILKDGRLDKLRHSFDEVNNYTYSKEDKIIKDLSNYNNRKYKTVKSILESEIKEVKKLKKNIKENRIYKYEKISNKINREKLYKNSINDFNNSLVDSYKNLYVPNYLNTDILKEDGEYLKKRIKKGFYNFNKNYLSYNEKLLSLEPSTTTTSSVCGDSNNKIKRKYEGIYVVDKSGEYRISYKLFAYPDERDGKEVIEYIDYDLDGDKDVLYSLGGNIYLKENLKKDKELNHLSGVEVLSPENNKYISGEKFISGVNNLSELSVSNGFFNLSFGGINGVSNYRLLFNGNVKNYVYTGTINDNRQNFIDAIAGNGEINIESIGKIELDEEEEKNYSIFKNYVYIEELGDNIGDLSLKTKELKNIKTIIDSGVGVDIVSKQKIYAGNNDIEITYLDENSISKNVELEAHDNIEFNYDTTILSITDNAYIETSNDISLVGEEINDYLGLVLPFNSKFELLNSEKIDSDTFVKLRYYDDSDKKIDFKDSKYFIVNEDFKVFRDIAYIDEIGSNIGQIALKTKKLENLKDSLIDGNVAIIQSHKKIYAGKEDVKIVYTVDSETTQEIEIKAHTFLEFNIGIKIISLNSDLYIMTEEYEILKGNDVNKYLGLPLSFDAEIVLLDENFGANSSSHITIKYYDNSEAKLDFRNIKYYNLYDLGQISNNYGVTKEVENGIIKATIEGFKNNIFSTKRTIVLSPQKQADKTAPDIKLSRIKIPFKKEESVDITRFVSEDSGIENIKEIKLDGLDSSKYSIEKTDSKIVIKFNKFDEILKKNIKIIVSDENDNIAEKEVIFEVYAPISKINNIDLSGLISGEINDKVKDMNINIYRVRGNFIKKLETAGGGTKVKTDGEGKFTFDINVISDNKLKVLVNDSNGNSTKLFDINQYTGKIDISSLLSSAYKLKVEIGDKHFINLGVYNSTNKIFNEKLDLSKIRRKVEVVDNFSAIDGKSDGLYFKFDNSNYDYYILPDNIAKNSQAFVIYKKSDNNKNPVFVILPDSRVKIYDGYKLEYSNYNDYVVIKLLDNTNGEIGELLFKNKSLFLIK